MRSAPRVSSRPARGSAGPRSVIVFGASDGGLEALKIVLAALPPDIPAAVLVVMHMAPDASAEILATCLRAHTRLSCRPAVHSERPRAGTIYLAQPDHHLLLVDGTIRLSKGARENRYRPSVDALFRSAAVTYSTHVIGAVLTGRLDDGTAGLSAIHRCGGVTVVQDPGEALQAGMPTSALESAPIDHSVPLAEMGPLLDRLARAPVRTSAPVPDDVALEALIARRVLSDVPAVDALGEQVPHNCPNCGGVLWRMAEAETARYRCHTGHAYTAASLFGAQSEKIEETLWVALRMMEERRNLLRTMTAEGHAGSARAVAERMRDAGIHIERIRELLMRSDKASPPSE